MRRLTWMAAGAGVRFVARRGVEKSIDDASRALEDKLPEPVVKMADKLPGDLIRAGGAATVASRGAARTGRSVTSATRAAAKVAPHLSPRNRPRPVRGLSDRIELARSAIRSETDTARRELASDYARHTEGDAAALEALLDLRDVEETPLPEVPDAIETGRRRFRPELPKPPVNRVQRTYQQKPKPWDKKRSDRGRLGR